MHKIAVISDIHSNIRALEATLEHIRAQDIDQIVCTGDIVGYHTFPDETVSLLRTSNITTIAGNHDRKVTLRQFKPEQVPDIVAFSWNALSESNRAWLADLPEELVMNTDGVSIRFCHGTPTHISSYLHEGSEASFQTARECAEDVLVSGHTHLPWVGRYNDTLMVNSGSVGKPKVGAPRATYAVLSFHEGTTSVKIEQLNYDHESVAAHAEAQGFKKNADALRSGCA
jgi:putative phosphoesterase